MAGSPLAFLSPCWRGQLWCRKTAPFSGPLCPSSLSSCRPAWPRPQSLLDQDQLGPLCRPSIPGPEHTPSPPRDNGRTTASWNRMYNCIQQLRKLVSHAGRNDSSQRQKERETAAYLEMQREPALVFSLSRETKHFCIITSSYNSALFTSGACHTLTEISLVPISGPPPHPSAASDGGSPSPWDTWRPGRRRPAALYPPDSGPVPRHAAPYSSSSVWGEHSSGAFRNPSSFNRLFILRWRSALFILTFGSRRFLSDLGQVPEPCCASVSSPVNLRQRRPHGAPARVKLSQYKAHRTRLAQSTQ